MAKLVPNRANKPREGGQWRGQVHIAPDFDSLPQDVVAAFGLTDGSDDAPSS